MTNFPANANIPAQIVLDHRAGLRGRPTPSGPLSLRSRLKAELLGQRARSPSRSAGREVLLDRLLCRRSRKGAHVRQAVIVLAGPRDRFECDVVRASDTGPLPLRGLRRVRLPPPGRAASPLASGSIAKKAAEEAESAQQREALERQGRRSRRKGAARSARTQDRGRRSGKRLEGPMRGAVTQRCLACNRASAAAQGSLQARA